jgi:pimeloyl-ACP methyl ester carboxylesterase
MSKAIAEGYATATTNGGVPSIDPVDWALVSPGNVDLFKLHNFASVALKDGVLAAKSVIADFYGRNVSYSYWSGCSQGGRQGYMFAQQYPDIFDGIAADAPAIYWPQLFSGHFVKQVMYEMNSYPHPCELDTLTNLAIAACDTADGLQDHIVSEPEKCYFDPYAQVGQPTRDCSTVFAPTSISRTAAVVADAAWHGANGTNGTSLWYTPGYSANMTAALATTTCASNGTCADVPNSLQVVWLLHFAAKDLDLDYTALSRIEYERLFNAGVREFDSVIGTSWSDLREFERAGGKMMTFYGYVRTHL